MIFEAIAIGILKTRQSIKLAILTLSDNARSQYTSIILTAILIIFFISLVTGWIIDYSISLKITNSIIYSLCLLMYGAVLYFARKKKQIIKINNQFHVVTTRTVNEESFDFDQLTPITSSQEDIKKLYQLFSKKHLTGSYNSFEQMLLLNSINPQNKLTWTDSIPKNPNQINRQTLFEFLSQLFSGFEILDNQSIKYFITSYFQEQNGNKLTISSKNISDWRANNSLYLKDISALICQAIKE